MRRCGAWVAAVSTVPQDEFVPPELRNSFDHWLDIAGKDSATAASLVSELSLDVLLNLDGFTNATQFDLFARRPAPLLVSWHNTFYTFGPGLFDCILADKTALSEAERREYAEDIIDVSPCPFTFTPPDDAPPVAPSPVLETGVITFGSMNRPIKISPQTIESWRRILDAVPGSWLFLRNSLYDTAFIDRVRGSLVAGGIASDRVVFAGVADQYEFLESYAVMDIALDCFPFNGGGTTLQALWQGVPVVTFAGERWIARLSASTLEACDLPELIAPDQRAFEELAIELARDVPRLVQLRSSIRGRVARSRLVDSPGFARQLVTKLREKVQARSAGIR
jgi:protein O-GlcNAc transferase